MSVKVVDLTAETLDLLPSPCRSCTYWELGSPREAVPTPGRAAAKAAWVGSAELAAGPVGKVLVDVGRVAGYALTAPPPQLRRSQLFVHHPSEDALLLATVWIAQEDRSAGAGKQLVRAVVADAHRRHFRAVEAYGLRTQDDATPEWACVVGEGFLTRMGFQVWRDHPHWPLLRLDLRQTVTDTMELALKQLRERLQPRRNPAPAQPSAFTKRRA